MGWYSLSRSSRVSVVVVSDIPMNHRGTENTEVAQRKAQLYPLAPTVGEPILRYLKEARPPSSYREVFLTTQSPIQPLSRSGLWHIVGRRLRPLSSSSLTHHGPHSLRHACATHLLAQGLSLKEIGDHLGHRSPNTTRTYAKVDIVGLRQVANFELGGLL